MFVWANGDSAMSSAESSWWAFTEDALVDGEPVERMRREQESPPAASHISASRHHRPGIHLKIAEVNDL